MERCATQDSVTNQQMLVFHGNQGIGKTRWISKLMPKKLHQYYFTGITNLEDQVFPMKLARNLLIFLDELDAYKGNKQAIIKSTITQDRIKVRPLFHTYDVEVKRRASIVAAINQSGFLNDLSGSRRFLVVPCVSINHNHTIDMDKLYSQVHHLAKDKLFRHYFDGDEIKQIEEANEEHKIKTDIEIQIERFVEPCKQGDEGSIIYTATEILNALTKIPNFKPKTNVHVVGETMKKMGFARVSKNTGDKKRWGYSLRLKKMEIIPTQITHKRGDLGD